MQQRKMADNFKTSKNHLTDFLTVENSFDVLCSSLVSFKRLDIKARRERQAGRVFLAAQLGLPACTHEV